jgi:hypothetical protein
MSVRKLPECPLCGAEFDIKNVDFASPFPCPVCEQYLCVPRVYRRFWGYASLVIAGLFCFLLGFRGANLALAALLACIPVLIIVVFWTRHFSPPKLKPSSSDNSHCGGPLGLDT